MEGGLGDHFAANRFVPAIKECHPSAKITLFSDTEGKTQQSDALKRFFPDHFDEIIVSPNRKSKHYNIESQFGKEEWNAHINNQPDEILTHIRQHDVFYDLHIDGLKWMYYDFDWFRYFYQFPKPTVSWPRCEQIDGNGFILTHLYARPNHPHGLEPWYVDRLIDDLRKRFGKVVIIADAASLDFYNSLDSVKALEPNSVVNATLEDCFDLASRCKAFIGMDSGIRYIPLHFGKPTFVFSHYHNGQSVAHHHLIRWLIFKDWVIPTNFNTANVLTLLGNAVEHPAGKLYPYFSNVTALKNGIVERTTK